MKNAFLVLFAMIMGFAAHSQTSDKPFSIGIEGGGEQYNGRYGDGFYKPVHGLWAAGGLYIYTYLSPHFDLGIQATDGAIGYKNDGTTMFKNNLFQANANVRFSFFKYDRVRLRPFLLLGMGETFLTGSNIPVNTRANNISLPDLGFGLAYKLSKDVNIKLQETFLSPFYTSFGSVKPDGYLLHSVGISYNFGHRRDADGDGVTDRNDQCPNTPAGIKVDRIGCPFDVDGDGIPDYLDACPDIKGVASAKGCPDSDGDSVADKDDKCPNTPAGIFVDVTGCPLDRDGDGIPDYQDRCPDQRGSAAMHGCPDSDGDGVADKDDKCPNTPTGITVDRNGCPPDRDGDGVADYMDKCPDVKGVPENMGCPVVKEEAKEVFKKALEGIEFGTGKYVIQKRLYDILDQVVAVMQENPSYNLEINGYTDNTGNAAANKTLSEKRAAAVKKYLVKKGIDEKRLKAAGFGGENPVADNDTGEGRKQNRRVEFIVSF